MTTKMIPDFERARRYVLQRLERELPVNLFFHGIHHTRDDVLPAAERLAGLEGIAGEELLLLRTAALYHDIGYIVQYNKNEPIGVRIAAETLPGFGYSKGQVERVGRIIMPTQLQSVDNKLIQIPDPKDILQLLICDADLDHLGKEDFFAKGENLRREWIEYGMPYTPQEWVKVQYDFQLWNSYFTAAAKRLRDEGKKKNIEILRATLQV